MGKTIVSFKTFAGNKDNYYNYKRQIEDATKSLRLAGRYCHDMESNRIYDTALGVLERIEFED